MVSKRKKQIITILIIAVSVFCYTVFSYKQKIERKEEIDIATKRGISFLYQQQKENGEFKELSCGSDAMIECYDSASLFSTALVLLSINDIENEKAKLIIQKGLKLFQDEKYTGSLWSYYGKTSKNFLLPDLDDTSMISFLMEKNNHKTEENIKFIDINRSSNKLFYTWLNPLDRSSNDVDCGVNANVLLYLNRNDQEVCDFINNEIVKPKSCSLYYPDKLTMYYIVSRAAKNGVSCLNEKKDFIAREVSEMQQEDGSFGTDIQNAFAVNTLINFEYKKDDAVGRGIDNVMKRQRTDGSWDEGMYWSEIKIDEARKYGSKELTTALSLEALNNNLDSQFFRIDAMRLEYIR